MRRGCLLPILLALALPAAAATTAPALVSDCAAVNPSPRPCTAATNAPTATTLWFEVVVPVSNLPAGALDPDAMTVALSWNGGSEEILGTGRAWRPGYSGSFQDFNDGTNAGTGVHVVRATPLAASRTYTVTVFARTNDGVAINPSASSWSFTTRRSLDGATVAWTIDASQPTVHWRGRWFAGMVKVNFDTSAQYDQEAVYALIDDARTEAPELFEQQRDFPLLGDYWQAGLGAFDGNANVVRERETRRIASMSAQGSSTVLHLTDLIEGPYYGIAPGRPLSLDYARGDQVLVCDRYKSEPATVQAVNDSNGTLKVSGLVSPPGSWTLDYPQAYRADIPSTPGNFTLPLGAVRKLSPVGTPVYWWDRVHDEFDRHVAHGRKPLVTFHGTPYDLCRIAKGENEYGGACPDRPKDYDQWDLFVRTFVGHLIDRYGPQTATWTWSVGNEPDLPIFWVGTDNEFLEYYDYTTNAILRAFEERAIDTTPIRIGGLEATGLFPGYEGQILYHCSPNADSPNPGAYTDVNFACANPAFAGRRAARVEFFCTNHANEGCPLDFLSVHSYDDAVGAAATIRGARSRALTLDAATYGNLLVSSHETTPDWIPRRDPASKVMYRWGAYLPAWGGDYFRRLLDDAVADPRKAGGESVLTVWPFNYNFEGLTSIAGLMRVDQNGDGTQDRVEAVRTPFFHFAALTARMSHDLRSIPPVEDAGVVMSGWRSVEPAADRFLLYAHDPKDTGCAETGGWDATLRLRNLRFPVVEVVEYRIDRNHPARLALDALPPKDPSTGLYSPAELAPLLSAHAIAPTFAPARFTVTNGALDLVTRLIPQSAVYLDVRRPDPDGDGVYDPDDNCGAIANATQANADGDPAGDACDCAPSDPGAWLAASEVVGVALAKSPATRVSWSPQAGVTYDVLGGDLGAAATVLAAGVATPYWDDARPDPAPGAGVYYLVRVTNGCE